MKKRVLIVDDEPNIVMSLEFLFRKNDFDVFIARNGTESLDILSEEVPDIILLDIMMPDVDGYEVCSFVRQHERFAQTKVVFLSAKSKRTDIDKGYEVGADLYITKPFSTRNLLKSVNELLASVA